jgi:S1-C subfamily serine protease
MKLISDLKFASAPLSLLAGIRLSLTSVAVLIVALTVSAASAEVRVMEREGVGPILVSVRIDLSGNSSELHAAALNDSGQPIAHAKFCVQTGTRTKGCDFEISTTALWKPGEELSWPTLKGKAKPETEIETYAPRVTVMEFEKVVGSGKARPTPLSEQSTTVFVQPAAMADLMVFKAKAAADERKLQQAEEWLLRAIAYDKANSPAIQALRRVQETKTKLSENREQARALLDAGRLAEAEKLITSLQPYRTLADLEVGLLEEELTAARRAEAAEKEFREGSLDAAIIDITAAEKGSPPESIFIKQTSSRVRREVATALLARVAKLPAETPSQLIGALKLASKATQADSGYQDAINTERRLRLGLAEKIVGDTNFLTFVGGQYRIGLEALNLTEDWIGSDPRFNTAKNGLRSNAYPAVRVRILIGDLLSCNPAITKDRLSKSILDSFDQLAKIDDSRWDLTLRIPAVVCSTVDAPKEQVEKVNSTFVAAQNQLVNEDYVRLQEQLRKAEAEVARVRTEVANNPGYGAWGGVADAMKITSAENGVKKVEADMRRTPPYITKDILQEYQYERFNAYRAYQIQGTLQVFSRQGDNSYSGEKALSFISDERRSGVSGVLPEDHTGVSNVVPTLESVNDYAGYALKGFLQNLNSKAEDSLAEYFATGAMNRSDDVTKRFQALLYLFDLANGTPYETEKVALRADAETATLSGQASIRDFVDRLALPLPERVVISDDILSPSTSRAFPERALEGVISIETDAGKAGSGFFLTPSCLIVTNAHVIEGAETIVVRSSKKLGVAEVLAKDSERDLALLKSNISACSALTLRDSSKAQVGEDIFTIGDPLGLSGTVTKGIVSAKRAGPTGINYLQIDAVINPGSSGGPLIASDGTVLGVNTFKVKGFEGLNFAVASAEIVNAFGRFLGK